ncbi:MAG TPA: YIP1 family protein [Vicinamibacterales bacterium]|nr:YIP1 family protein [Vicinamibacterales bacterium]
MLVTFLRRLAGAAILDAGTYEEVEGDRGAMPQALAVVLLSSVSAGIGLSGGRGAAATFSFFAVASFLALTAWGTFALIAFQVGSRLLPMPGTRTDPGELLRTLGFAAAPGLIQMFALFTPAPIVLSVLAFAWTIAASVVAVRQALDFTSTRRAFAVCLVAWGLPLAIAVSLAVAVSGA